MTRSTTMSRDFEFHPLLMDRHFESKYLYQAIEATFRSMEKWMSIWNGTGVDNGRDNCALCDLDEFYMDDNNYHNFCKNCPLHLFGNAGKGCSFTPYDEWNTICNIKPIENECSEDANEADVAFMNIHNQWDGISPKYTQYRSISDWVKIAKYYAEQEYAYLTDVAFHLIDLYKVAKGK